MRPRLLAFALSLALPLAPASAALAASAAGGPSRMLTDPALSADRIAFVYGNDVWTCRLDGGGVQRITSGPGAKMRPAFSPDGSLLAFSAELDGNLDVFVVPAAGGVPKRLTWHPGRDVVQGFTPDGKSVLFASPRAAVNNRHTQLYTVPVDGGLETPLPIPYADRAAYSPDGRTIAYSPNAPRHLQWKRYRGGTVSKVWLFDVASNAVDRVPQPATRCNDADPMWLDGPGGPTVVLRSDRDGEFNLFAFAQGEDPKDPSKKSLKALTRYTDFPVLNAAASAGKIVFEQAGTLHLYDFASRAIKDLSIAVPGDLLETRPRWAKGAKWIRGAAISPSGARAAFEFRGEIVTVPAEKGDARNLTNTTAFHERAPAWSPDGKEIAYVSDESGENELVVRAQDGKGSPKRIKVPGAGFYDELVFSPDGKKIVLTDNSLTLFVVDVASGASKKIASERLYAPARYKMLRGSWSPDSRWVAYTLSGPTYIRTAFVYSVDEDKSYALTDGLSDVSDPAFDRAGKLLYFLASTDAGPQRNWFSLQNTDARITNAIYVATLKKGTPSPLAKESDEEKGEAAAKDGKSEEKEKEEDSSKGHAGGRLADSKDGDATGKAGDKGSGKDVKPPKPPGPVVIDRDGFNLRIVDLPIHPAEISNLQAGSAGQVFFLRKADGKTSVQRFDFKDRKTETVVPEVEDYFVSHDGRKILVRQKEKDSQKEAAPASPQKETWSIVSSSPKKGDAKDGADAKPKEGSDGKLKLDAIAVRVDPRDEWPEIFDEAWRVNRDYFYDPKMHGRDWAAVKAKYAPFLPYLSSRGDLNRLIQWMCSELAVGHHRNTPGDAFAEVVPVPGGLLGADYEVASGRYRFRKVFGGLNWNPELRAPLSEPGVEVKSGEYLLAVNGKGLAPPENLYARFEGTAGKIVEITVGPAPDGKGSRTVSVVPVADEAPLRTRDWVESNLRKVDAATGGRVAYVYVPNTADLGHTYFKRYFYPQASRDAIIVDERFNGGGSVADYYIEALTRQPIAWWAMRYGEDLKTPSASIQGPKVMLIDETAGSGGDLLPWMFRHFKVGTIVGQRTWGGLVGVLGFPTLMDGAVVTAPNLGFWTPEEGFGVENVGVPPDVEVEQTPADVIAGHDPQLEKAISIVMEELKKNPPVKPKRPKMPVR
ncbi:MAG TPA: PDZ domain-containing protein [Thermoanaerobaculia bacterium]|nr:PDZ domain-containing protein [Thermoanaerobaculia bacterium]